MHHTTEERLATPIMFTCEHASSTIPFEYDNLGLTDAERDATKDLFDPGSLLLAQKLAARFNATLVYPNYSRLLIDANRSLGATTNATNTFHAAALKTELLIEDAEGERLIPITGNVAEDPKAEEAARWNEYVLPIYQDVERIANTLVERFGKVCIFQIHSFYPTYDGSVRIEDIDVLHSAVPLADDILEKLRASQTFNIGDNKPWAMSDVGGGLLEPLRVDPRIQVMGFDVNNRNLTSDAEVQVIATMIGDAIAATEVLN